MDFGKTYYLLTIYTSLTRAVLKADLRFYDLLVFEHEETSLHEFEDYTGNE